MLWRKIRAGGDRAAVAGPPSSVRRPQTCAMTHMINRLTLTLILSDSLLEVGDWKD